MSVEATGGNYALLQSFTALTNKNIRLTPDVLVQGGQGSNGTSDSLLAIVLRDLLDKNRPKAA